MTKHLSRVLSVVALLAIAAAAWFAVRLAWADLEFRRGTLASVERASKILPNETRYLLFRALQLDYEGQDSTALLEKAAALNPLSSAPRIRLGLAAETRGDLPAAEKWLLEAARVDQQFEPRWTLANFYFRRGDSRRDDFWQWMRAALEHSYGDRRLAFDLCWRASDRPDEILSRAIPRDRFVRMAYVDYLLAEHPESAGPPALALAEFEHREDRPLIELAAGALISANHPSEARDLWKRIGFPDPLNQIVNEHFSDPPSGRGFDWLPIEQPGVAFVHLEGGAGERVTLSGRQPESCELLRQVLLLTPGRRYLLRWDARTLGASSIGNSPSGLSWQMGDQRFAIEPASENRAGQAAFTARSELATLALIYQRPSGQARLEGSIEIHSVSLDQAPVAPKR